jgi:hypothetical protein
VSPLLIDNNREINNNDTMMQTGIQLSNEIILEAGKYASVYTRSLSMQIEHWAHAALAARIGKIAEENPDLPYSFIEDVLLGKSELDNGSVTPFEFKLN